MEERQITKEEILEKAGLVLLSIYVVCYMIISKIKNKKISPKRVLNLVPNEYWLTIRKVALNMLAEELGLRRINLYEWKLKCLERDEYRCQKCSDQNKLNVHHIFNYNDFPFNRDELENGIVLCKKCHQEFHKKYGRKNNTKGQLEEFLRL
jgi:hypothetical protein